MIKRKRFYKSKIFAGLLITAITVNPAVLLSAAGVEGSTETTIAVNEETVETYASNEPAQVYANSEVEVITVTDTMKLTKDIKLTQDTIIEGDGTIELGNYQMNAGDFNLTLSGNLIINANSSLNKPAIIGNKQFIVDFNSNIEVRRPNGTATSNLIQGFSDFTFKESSVFKGIARTNLAASNHGSSQTAIIQSSSTNNFIVEWNAKVTLTSDSSGNANTHGCTALNLKKPKGGLLNIVVEEGGELNIDAAGTNSTARSMAPVVIVSHVVSDAGTSSTTIKGTLNVNSKNGNGWYYQYIDYNTIAKDEFIVDGGCALITADGKEVIRRAGHDTNVTPGEYAAFEHYGPAGLTLSVINGGNMKVKTNGWRAVSMAGGILTSPDKTITVDGGNSSLILEGGQFAIAAEGKTNLTINVTDGGYMKTQNTQDSNVYTTGKVTYNVKGYGSVLEMVRTGMAPTDPLPTDRTLYGVIFHDAPLVGPLTINVLEGGYMTVGTCNGSRAAITTQSNYRTDHKITVDGHDSTLLVNSGTTAGATASDYTLYPVGAIAFAANCSGNIEIKNGGNFYAQSFSPSSPTIALGSYAGSKYSGTLTLDQPGIVDIWNNAANATKRAVALRGRNYDPGTTAKDSLTTLIANVDSIIVYDIGQGPDWTAAANEWNSFKASAPNKDDIMVDGGSNGNTFRLASYGRIRVGY